MTKTVEPAPPDVAVTGIVRAGGRQYALIEQVSTGRSSFLAEGDSALGYTVKAIHSDAVHLARGETQWRLALGENKPERPLVASAATLTNAVVSTSGPESQMSAPSSTEKWADPILSPYYQFVGEQTERGVLLFKYGRSLDEVPPDVRERLERARQLRDDPMQQYYNATHVEVKIIPHSQDGAGR
jgi:hypothetical protein